MAKTVILIDDDQDDLDILAECITKVNSGFYCMTFCYPLEAVRVISEELIVVPDFVFTDINMPILKGDDLVKSLRRNSHFDNTIITVFSTAMPERTQEEMKAIGADFAFQKPTQIGYYDVILNEIFSARQA